MVVVAVLESGSTELAEQKFWTFAAKLAKKHFRGLTGQFGQQGQVRGC
jgi:hypothetical protein